MAVAIIRMKHNNNMHTSLAIAVTLRCDARSETPWANTNKKRRRKGSSYLIYSSDASTID